MKPTEANPRPDLTSGARRLGDTMRARLETGIPIIDYLITVITAKALPHQRPLIALDGAILWLLSVAMLFISLGVNIFLLLTMRTLGWAGLALLPLVAVGVVCTTGRLRVLQVVFAHHGKHNTGSRRWPFLNSWMSEISTALAVAQNPVEYDQDHVKGGHHKHPVFTTLKDADAGVLVKVKIEPGLEAQTIRGNFWRASVSPSFHGSFLRGRLGSALVRASWTHKVLVGIWLLALLTLALSLPWWVFTVAVVLPLGPGYQISALMQFMTEHRWLLTRNGPRGQADYARRCVGRFALVTPPSETLSGLPALAAWAWWAVRMVPPLLVRLGVWVGDLPAHDIHHMVGFLRYDAHDWTIAVFERQRAIDAGDVLGLADREVFTFGEALTWVVDGLASAEPLSGDE